MSQNMATTAPAPNQIRSLNLTLTISYVHTWSDQTSCQCGRRGQWGVSRHCATEFATEAPLKTKDIVNVFVVTRVTAWQTQYIGHFGCIA